MPNTTVTKVLLDEFGRVTQSYPVHMQPEDDYGIYGIIVLGCSDYSRKENKNRLVSTQVDLRKWDSSTHPVLPKTERKRAEELDRKFAEARSKSCFGDATVHNVGISVGGSEYQLKDLVIVNAEAERIPAHELSGVTKVFQRNCLKLVTPQESLTFATGHRHVYAVVRNCFCATMKADMSQKKGIKGEVTLPLPEGGGVKVGAGASGNESLVLIGNQSVIGIRMTLFRMERVSSEEDKNEGKWTVSNGIPIANGRKLKDLKNHLIWTSRTLNKTFGMFWHPERHSIIMVDCDAVCNDDESLDLETRTRFRDRVMRKTAAGLLKMVGGAARIRGGGPEEEIDNDGFVLDFDLRSLEKSVMGLSLLPVDFEALDHKDFDTLIEWNTVTIKHNTEDEDGSENVDITPRELHIQAVINAKLPLLEFCIESLEQPHEEKPAGKRKGIPEDAETAMKKTKGESAAATNLERSDSLSPASSLEATTVTTSAVTTTESMADSVAEVAVADSSADAVLSKAID